MVKGLSWIQNYKTSEFGKKEIEIFIHSGKSLPEADFWIFIIRKEHNINGGSKKK